MKMLMNIILQQQIHYFGVALHEGTSFPVGKVDFMDLYPLNFKEFLIAIGEEELSKLIDKKDWNLINIFKDKYIDLLRKYHFIGGMPAAINKYIETTDFKQVRKTQNQLLKAYEEDFSKHTTAVEANRISIIWNSIPSQLARENKKFLYQVAKEGARAREYEGAVNWLNDADLIHKIYNVVKPNMPLKAYNDLSSFKIYLNDVGLLRRMTDLDSRVVIEGNRVFKEFKGALTENYVLQMLLSSGIKVNYFTFDNKYEIDYIMQYKNTIIPIEVKADENINSVSLKHYNEIYNPKIRIRFSMRNLKKDDNLVNIPLFMVEYLEKFL